MASMQTNRIESSSSSTEFADSAYVSSVGEGDAIELLIAQHREIDVLLRQLEQSGSHTAEAKSKTFAMLMDKILQHAEVEEAIFYPAVQDIDRRLVVQAFEEHDVVKYLLRDISKLQPGSELFAAKVHVMKELLRHHIAEEEGQLLPECRSVCSEKDMALIGQRMREATAQWKTPISAEMH